MALTSKITCPYCNGDGHLNFRDCLKCGGTGELLPNSSQPVKGDNFSVLKKLLLAWAGFIILSLLIVYVVIFLDDLGIKDTVITISLSGVSWLLILKGCFMLYRNTQKPPSERMPFFNPNSSRLVNVAVLIFLILFALPIIYFALIPVIRILN